MAYCKLTLLFVSSVIFYGFYRGMNITIFHYLLGEYPPKSNIDTKNDGFQAGLRLALKSMGGVALKAK